MATTTQNQNDRPTASAAQPRPALSVHARRLRELARRFVVLVDRNRQQEGA